ncbi:reverse transcriptase domain-containing protein [Paenibacillus dendritiformis]|uniref:reverse transcriptase domain-containing protein n=1 Tax=Paenibacillus dendritiformis TaxID=130049 RepID=UPI000DAACF6C|nr:reverse transcriptase domain-containing protein [Paenibacillus dendritiformis]PZM64869.1 RNA-dependent DNA polymerase [Paenibacillus dendritiformis]
MPRRFGELYPQIYDFENLHTAYLKARKNKRFRHEVMLFSSNLEENLIQLQNELIWKMYRTSPYREFIVYEPKMRHIKALPFRDRVVQHAVNNVIEPLFEPTFIYDTYACRVGKGMHAGSDRLVSWLQETHRKWDGRVYVLKADIAKYFPSIDHDILIRLLWRKIKCKETMQLLQHIVRGTEENNVGIPVGNLTSQLFANVYLSQLDHYVKETLRVRYYVRYMDDFVILHHDKQELHRLHDDIERFLRLRLRLRLNPKTAIFPASQGINFLGYRTWRTHRLVRKSSIIRMKRKMRKFRRGFAEGKVDLEEVNRTVQSWIGHVKHANSYNLRKKLFETHALTKELGKSTSEGENGK